MKLCARRVRLCKRVSCEWEEAGGPRSGRGGRGGGGREASECRAARGPAAPIHRDGDNAELMGALVWWLAACCLVRAATAGNPDAKRLYDDLLSNYNKLVRPVVNTTDVLRVCIKLKLSQLIDVVSPTIHRYGPAPPRALLTYIGCSANAFRVCTCAAFGI